MLVVQTELPDPRSSQGAIPEGISTSNLQLAKSQMPQLNTDWY